MALEEYIPDNRLRRKTGKLRNNNSDYKYEASYPLTE